MIAKEEEEGNDSYTIQAARSRDALAARVSGEPTDYLCVNRANKTVSNTLQTKYSVGAQFHIIGCYYMIPL